MDRDAQVAKEMTKNLPFKERLANFWYYKKWWVIAAIAAVIVIAITVYEIATMPQYDLIVGYYSETGISDESLEKLKNTLAQYSQDINNDGKITVSITPMQASRESETDEQAVVETRLMSELTGGDNMLYICDQAYRDYLMNGDNAECFEAEFNMAEHPELKQEIGYIEDTLYVLLKELYEREEDNSDKRMAHNNAATVFEGICGNISAEAIQSMRNND